MCSGAEYEDDLRYLPVEHSIIPVYRQKVATNGKKLQNREGSLRRKRGRVVSTA
jgi:hypothetical protein